MSVTVTEATTRDEIAEALGHVNARAMRLMHHPDCGEWVKLHRAMDELLDSWLEADDGAASLP